ncbi:MAG: hypothetical protein IJT37_10685 [Lachnospiraceae bacterium]|nr:hypothetical protein [Lachnospiraceae bacterium]
MADFIMDKGNRSVYKAAAVVAGNGIGSGVMAIPYYVLHAGTFGGMAAFAAAYIVSMLMHFMIATMVLRTMGADEEHSGKADILDIFNRYLFKGRAGMILRFAFFALLVVVLTANLSAYISGAAQIFTQLLPVNGTAVKVIFFVAAAFVILAGLGAVCTTEAVTVSVMVVILLLMLVFSVLHIRESAELPLYGGFKEWAAAYSMIMFSFSAIFAVPQVVEYMTGEAKLPGKHERDKENSITKYRPEREEEAGQAEKKEKTGTGEQKKQIRRSIWLGLLINLIISATVAVCTIVTSKEVTDIAIVGWADAVGGTIRVLGSVFIVFAMLTSFWSIGLASADIVAGQTHIKRELSFVIATVPALIMTLILSNTFAEYLKLVGGAVAVIIALMAVPSYLLCMRDQTAEERIEGYGEKAVAVFVFIMYIIMAAGSFISV